MTASWSDSTTESSKGNSAVKMERDKIFLKCFGGDDKQSEKDVRQGQVAKSNGAGQLTHFTDLIDHKKNLGKFPLTAVLRVACRREFQLLFSEGGEWREAMCQVLLSLYSSY